MIIGPCKNKIMLKKLLWLSLYFQSYLSTSEWTLDYPPFFAHFEHFLAIIASKLKLDPLLLKISAEPISNPSIVLFQKTTVIVTDFVLLLGVYFLSKTLELKEKNCLIFSALTIGNFGLFLVDHIHFQYNGILLGLSLIFLASFLSNRFYTAAFIFTSMLHFKVPLTIQWPN